MRVQYVDMENEISFYGNLRLNRGNNCLRVTIPKVLVDAFGLEVKQTVKIILEVVEKRKVK